MEGMEEKVEHPGYDDAVVDADETVYDKARYPDANKVGRDGVPRHDGSLPGSLTKRQLQVKERDTENKEHDEIWE